MKNWDQIVTTVRARQNAQDPLLRQMLEVRRRYNADWVLPVPNDPNAAQMPSTTPQLIGDAVDFVGMRAASVFPMMFSPAIDPAKERGVGSREYANTRRRIIDVVHHKSMTRLHLRRAMRHLAGYATTSLVVVPDLKDEHIPKLELRDPLTSYPEPKAAEDLSPPSDCAFVYVKSREWLLAHYPETAGFLGRPSDTGSEQLWEIVEWVDCDQTVIGLLGPRDAEQSRLPQRDIVHMKLRAWPNPTGVCPAYVPRKITLDKIVSQMATLVGQVDLMNQLQTLVILATEKNIFPDRYIIGDSTRPPQIIGGEWKDGRTGEVNMVVDGEIGQIGGQTDPSAVASIDRLERNVRMSTGLVPQAGGESYGALRTGRGMDALMGAAVDPRIQEMQEIMEVGLEHVNKVALEQLKAYWPNRSYAMFSGRGGDRSLVNFVPKKHIETTENSVTYTIPGADVQGTTILLGQLLGMKGISLATLRARHPYIDDPDAEGDRVEEELLEQAVLEAIGSQAAQGAIPVTHVARIEKYRRGGLDIIQSVLKADEDLKAEQAKMAPPPGEGDFAAPEQMPGVAGPGPMPPTMPPEMAAALAGGPPIEGEPPMPPGQIGPEPNQQGLQELMAALSQRPVRT